MMCRKVKSEILDSLSADDQAAIRSRRDLVLINRVCGNFRWLMKSLRRMDALGGENRIIELGAGDGSFARYLIDSYPEADYLAVDLAPRPSDFPAHWSWDQQDIFDGVSVRDTDIVIANLFLHHFTFDQLKELGGQFGSAKAMIANEPERHWLFRGLGYFAQTLFGFNYVTRHDMHISIDAGFRGNELIESLGFEEGRQSKVRHSAMGFYRMISYRE